MLGRVLGVAERGESIAGEMRARRDTVVQAVADAPRPKLFYEMDASDQTKPFAAGPNGFYGQLVDLAGAANIYADVPGDFAQVSAESVVAGNLSRVVSSVRFGLEKFRIGFEDLQWNGRRDVPVRSSFRAPAP